MSDIIDFDKKIHVAKPTKHYIYGLVLTLILAFSLYFLNYFVFSVGVDWRNDYQIFDATNFTDLSFLGKNISNVYFNVFEFDNCTYSIFITDEKGVVEPFEGSEVFNGGNLYFLISSDCSTDFKKEKVNFILRPMKRFNGTYVSDVINSAIIDRKIIPDIYYICRVIHLNNGIKVRQMRGKVKLEFYTHPLSSSAKTSEKIEVKNNDVYYFEDEISQRILFNIGDEIIIIESENLDKKTKDEMINLAEQIIGE